MSSFGLALELKSVQEGSTIERELAQFGKTLGAIIRLRPLGDCAQLNSARSPFQPFDKCRGHLVANDHDTQHAVLPQEVSRPCPSRFDGGVTGPSLGHA